MYLSAGDRRRRWWGDFGNVICYVLFSFIVASLRRVSFMREVVNGESIMKDEITITVFTPTYNRGYIIANLYKSLLAQEDKNFEWLIVDDDSNDNTEELVKAWMGEAPFRIRYHRQPHGGKHRAINWGVSHTDSELFFIVDSDDILTSDAIMMIRKFHAPIRHMKFAGLSFCLGHLSDAHGYQIDAQGAKTVGGEPKFDKDSYVDATNFERGKYGLLGDKAEVYRTEILRQYPFPAFDGEDFLTEGTVWNKIAADGLKLRWVNRIIYLCEYREDGLSHNSYEKFCANPNGWAAYIKVCLETGQAQDAKAMCVRFYEAEHDKFGNEDIQAMLGLSSNEYAAVVQKYEDIRNYIAEIVTKRNIKNAAVYGAGTNGHRMASYLRETGVNICYAIDQKFDARFTGKTYRPDDELPNVDAIFITPKSSSGIREMLIGKTYKTILCECSSIPGFI